VDIMSSLRRRWVLTCALLLVTLAASAAAWQKLPPTYQSVSSLVLLAPQSQSKAFGDNPYLAFNGTLNQTADVVRYETNDVRTADSLRAEGYTSSYLVTDAIDTSGPVLIVTVTGSSATEVEHTLSGVTTAVSTKLQALQAGLAPDNTITDVVITYMPQASFLKSKKEKPVLLFLVLGLVLTIGIPVVVDAQRARRAASQEARSDGEHPGSAGRPREPAAYPARNPEEWRPAQTRPGPRYNPPPRHDPGEPLPRRGGGRETLGAVRQPTDAISGSGPAARPAGNRTR
jgi:hypothetical protein